MATLKIVGTKKYVGYMSKHLSKEHPKTKGHITIGK
jgi:hypothetical protein